VDISALAAAGGQLQVLANYYNEYVGYLTANYRCDFSQVQLRFLEFLKIPIGHAFRDGDGTDLNVGIQWVLVDEYQDTNPVQEEIYFELAKRAPNNLMVVGDDDQAMYRFRGGSVECMVTFDDACTAFLGLPKTAVARYPLVDNYRSHTDIVTFFDDYISSFPIMGKPGSRAIKPSIRAKRVIRQSYPTVSRLGAARLDLVAEQFAKTVKGLVDSKVVNDPSECCLLLKSAKDSPNNAGKYVQALKDEGLSVYNPRNKAFAQQEEVQGLLGAILAVVDPDRRYATDPVNKNAIPPGELDIRATYDSLASVHTDLANYVASATAELKKNPGAPLSANLQELGYYLLSLEPFSSWQNDPVRRVRLGQLSKLLEAYSSMPVLDTVTGKPKTFKHKVTGKELGLISRGFMRASKHHPGEVVGAWLGSFYHLFLGYVLSAGIDDEEDEDIIAPNGMVPVMTMHQAKGLEFPFVFVGHLGETASISSNHELESLFSKYPSNSARTGICIGAARVKRAF
jgi:DNA helicase-2/ATP-dependent DNA helicase PcrA